MPMAAVPIVRLKRINEDGSIIEIRIWRLPRTSDERPHGFKYSLFYGRPGERIVGYDNEAGNGDYRHLRKHEEPYILVSLARLLADFEADVRRARREP